MQKKSLLLLFGFVQRYTAFLFSNNMTDDFCRFFRFVLDWIDFVINWQFEK